MTTFEPSTWKKAGEVMNTAADDMYRSAYAVIRSVPAGSNASMSSSQMRGRTSLTHAPVADGVKLGCSASWCTDECGW